MEEVWKDIEEYEGFYQVSNLGRVRSLDRVINNKRGIFIKKGKLKAICTLSKGYKGVLLCHNGTCKTHKIHRLVAKTFIPNPDNLPQVNHKDEDKTNNSVDNLEWCDCRYNVRYSQTKPVLQFDLKGNLIKKWDSIEDAANAGYTKSAISKCCHEIRNKHKNYIWCFEQDYNKKDWAA